MSMLNRQHGLFALSLSALFVLAGCTTKTAPSVSETTKPVDVETVVKQKIPVSVKDRNSWAKDLATTFKSQDIAPSEENICSVLAVAQQESNLVADPAVPNLSKIAWKEIDRRA